MIFSLLYIFSVDGPRGAWHKWPNGKYACGSTRRTCRVEPWRAKWNRAIRQKKLLLQTLTIGSIVIAFYVSCQHQRDAALRWAAARCSYIFGAIIAVIGVKIPNFWFKPPFRFLLVGQNFYEHKWNFLSPDVMFKAIIDVSGALSSSNLSGNFMLQRSELTRLIVSPLQEKIWRRHCSRPLGRSIWLRLGASPTCGGWRRFRLRRFAHMHYYYYYYYYRTASISSTPCMRHKLLAVVQPQLKPTLTDFGLQPYSHT